MAWDKWNLVTVDTGHRQCNFMFFLPKLADIDAWRHTVSGRSCFRGLDLGVEVKMGNLWGRRSGDMEQSLVAGELGGERLTGRRDADRGGRWAV